MRGSVVGASAHIRQLSFNTHAEKERGKEELPAAVKTKLQLRSTGMSPGPGRPILLVFHRFSMLGHSWGIPLKEAFCPARRAEGSAHARRHMCTYKC